MIMIDLFAGRKGASEAMRRRGWTVYTIELERRFGPDIVADCRYLPLRPGLRPDLLWASPPCDEFSREFMPWCRTGKAPSMALVEAAYAARDLLKPKNFILENVKGAVRYLGQPRQRIGPIHLWGSFPVVLCHVLPWKERLSSTRSEERAMMPYRLSLAVALAVEDAVRAA